MEIHNTKVFCPGCKGTQVQRVSIIYESGTNTGKSSGGFIGIPLDGESGATIGTISANNQNQSLLAERLSPPQQKSTSIVFYLPLIVSTALIIFLFGFKNVESPIFLSIWFLSTLIPLLGIAKFCMRDIYRYNSVEYPILMDRWKKSWFCHQCGQMFIPDISESRPKKIAQTHNMTYPGN